MCRRGNWIDPEIDVTDYIGFILVSCVLCMHAARISPPPRNDDNKDNDNIESFSSNDDEDY